MSHSKINPTVLTERNRQLNQELRRDAAGSALCNAAPNGATTLLTSATKDQTSGKYKRKEPLLKPSTPKTELPPSTQLRKVVLGGSLKKEQ